ncbi:MAG: ASCH domain-containing protein [Salinivirgaceae bacterium]|nr:ASCH domain-containing protein [Salinivirgaceae bacterium]
MKILTLIIKQRWFDEIMSGKKTIEYREVKPTNYKKLIETDEEGYIKEVPDSEVSPYYPKKYDAIRFYVGYAKDRDTALVKVKEVENKAILNDKGEFIYSGDPNGEDFWVYSENQYHLGEVVEKTHNHRAK